MADRKEFDIDGKPLSSLRVVDLKLELEKRGMSKSGSKKELSDRLKMQLQLEKLHESASTDDGHVPNLRLQDDEIAEHSDLIKDYLAKQQQIYEIQKEAIRRVELEEQRVRESSEASAGDTSQEEEEIDANRPKTEEEPCAEDLTVTRSKRKVVLKNVDKMSVEESQDKIEESREPPESAVILPDESNLQDEAPMEPNTREAVLETEISKSVETEATNQTVDNDEIASAITSIEESVIKVNIEEADTERKQSDNSPTESSEHHEGKPSPEADENAVAVDSIMLDVHVTPEDSASLPETGVDVPAESVEATEPNKSELVISTAESSTSPSDLHVAQEEKMDVEMSKQDDATTCEKEGPIEVLPGRNLRSKRSSGEKPREIDEEDLADVSTKDGEDSREKEMEVQSPAKESDDVTMQSHRSTPEAAQDVKSPAESDSTKGKKEVKRNGKDNHKDDGDQQKANKKSLQSKSPPRGRRRRRSSSTQSSSSDSDSSSRSKSSGSSSQSSKSASRSRSPSPEVGKKKPIVAPPSEESMETTNDDSISRPFPKQSIEAETEGEDKTGDVEDSSSAADTVMSGHVDKSKDSEVVDKPPEKVQPLKISSRKISLSSSKTKKDDGEGKGNDQTSEEQPQRKRRWGGSSTVAATVGKKLSLSISTDSLKGLLPDVKPLAALKSGLKEPLPDSPIENNSANSGENGTASKEERPKTPVVVTPTTVTPTTKRDLIIFRTVTQVVKDGVPSKFPERDAPKGKLVVKNSTPITFNDEDGAGRRSPSPPRYPPSCIVHIRNLVRPFTDTQLKELLSRTGTLVDGGFWMDKIKSKCYATFESEEQAVATRHALHGVQWPYSNPKRLSVDFATRDELEFHRSLTDNPEFKRVIPASRNPEPPERTQKSPPPPSARRKEITMAEAAPAVAARQRKDSHRSDRDKDKRDPKHGANRVQADGRQERLVGGREREAERSRGRDREAVSGPQQHPIREWDRDKIGEKSPGERARAARNRGRSHSSRSRSRSRIVRSPVEGFGRGRMREMDVRDRRDRKEHRKDEEEAPAKLLDDLFHKTKSTPCIYWLPLTGEQIKSREDERRQRQVEREKRRQMEQGGRDRPTGVAHMDQVKRNREGDNSRIRKRSESPARSRTRRH